MIDYAAENTVISLTANLCFFRRQLAYVGIALVALSTIGLETTPLVIVSMLDELSTSMQIFSVTVAVAV